MSSWNRHREWILDHDLRTLRLIRSGLVESRKDEEIPNYLAFWISARLAAVDRRIRILVEYEEPRE